VNYVVVNCGVVNRRFQALPIIGDRADHMNTLFALRNLSCIDHSVGSRRRGPARGLLSSL
jgi:hypothetical protein